MAHPIKGGVGKPRGWSASLLGRSEHLASSSGRTDGGDELISAVPAALSSIIRRLMSDEAAIRRRSAPSAGEPHGFIRTHQTKTNRGGLMLTEHPAWKM